MLVVSLPTKKEVEILTEQRKKSKTLLIQDRAHAILLIAQGYHAPEIGRIIDRDRTTVERWLHQWNDTRISSIFPAYADNTNASKLTETQLKEIKKALSKPPSTEGSLPSAFWDIKHLKSYITAQYGVIYESDRSYHHLFAISGYSFKLPEGFDRRRNDALVNRRMAEIQIEMKELEKRGYIQFAADECSLAWETEYRRAWLKQGEKTVLKVSRKKIRQNYFGALNLRTGREELIPLSWQNTETMIEAIRELTKRYVGQRLALIWDNAKWHRSKELRALLGMGKEFSHIRFIWLPPYAPDKNPQEHVWKAAKDVTANTVTETFEQLKNIFENTIRGKVFNYKM